MPFREPARGNRASDARPEVLRGRAYWPSADQELLLRAAVQSGPPAADAWRQLAARIDPEGMDVAGARRVLAALAGARIDALLMKGAAFATELCGAIGLLRSLERPEPRHDVALDGAEGTRAPLESL